MGPMLLLPFFLTFVGGVYLFKLRGLFLVYPRRCLGKVRLALRGKQGKKTRRSFLLALAGTLGVGNVSGVATSLCLGGAGAVFWMVVSTLFSAPLKFAEVTLVRSARADGMPDLLAKEDRRLFGAVYSAFGILTAFSMGAGLQGRAAFDSITALSEKIPPRAVCLALGILVALATFGGIASVGRVTAVTVPTATLLYTILCIDSLICNHEALISAFRLILSDAFSPGKVGAGFFGFLIGKSMKEGYFAGLLSNESGAGTSAFAHAEEETDAVTSGLLGVLEVLFDTAVLCPLTAVTLLASGVPLTGGGVPLVTRAFLTGGLPKPEWFLAASVTVFAYSSTVTWYCYGKKCLHFLKMECLTPLFWLGFCVFCGVGGAVSETLLVRASDLSLFGMTAVTLPLLYKKADRVKALSAECGLFTKRECRREGCRRRSRTR